MTTPTSTFHAAREFLLANRGDDAAACAGFAWPQLERFNWALDHFDVIARGNDACALAIVQEDGSSERFSFAELSARSNQLANWLVHLGIKRGDRVLLMLGNQKELWESMLALMKIGAVMVPTTTLLSPADLHDRVQRGHVRHVICAADVVPRMEQLGEGITRIVVGAAVGWQPFQDSFDAPTAFTPDGSTLATDPLLLYFTSGTTTKPKLVLHTHQSYPVGHLSTMYWMGVRPGDIHLNISSPGWAKHAWSCFFGPWNAGACVLVYNYARFSARELLKLLVDQRVTTLCAPPTVWRMLIQEDLAATPVQLRELFGAGEPLNPEVIEQVRKAWSLDIRDGFGQTETTCQIGNPPGVPIKPGSMGRPLPGFPIVLLDADGRPADEGEICIDLARRPLGLMQAYFGDEEKTAEAMRDGHYHTGDVASRDADGYITYVGRADDVFKASGYRISPFELESVLIEHSDVAEAAVVPSPDPVRTNIPKAFIVLRAGAEPGRDTALSILRFAREQLAPYKRIRRIEFADLPKTISGKIQRNQLRKLESEQVNAQVPPVGSFREEDFPELAG
ncbi:AMP-binding protein [Piscinibacter sakaiensis]|uniref:AMP-binding protein n=1 Tax=Piscinibacter sakaiensis TaxID=1547922 RepID=UPI003AADE447